MNITYVIIMSMIVVALLATVIIIFFVYSRKKILHEKVLKQNMELKFKSELLYTSIKSQEKERARIARDLHDDIGGKLNLVYMNLQLLKKPGTARDKLPDLTEETLVLVNKTIEDTRRVSHDLMPVVLEKFGLLKALEELRDNFNKISGISVELNLKAEESHFGEFEKNNIFRIVQELLKNAVQHSGADHLSISLKSEEKEMKLNYADNGKGFSDQKLKEKAGLGLKSIMSRVDILGGKINWKTAWGKGVEIEININKNNE